MRTPVFLCLLLVGTTLATAKVMAADHTDAPGVVADPAADINDYFVFTNPNDADELIAIMTVLPLADTSSMFSDAVEYVFHFENDASPPDSYELVCTFDASQNVTCDGAGLSVSGASGSTQVSGDIRVWAGLRDDPFYFDLVAFNETVAQGSPQFTDPGTNFFAGLNVLAIVVGIQSDALTNDGAAPVLKTYTSTRRVSE